MRTEKTFKSVVLVVMLFALWMALCGCSSVQAEYAKADALTYNAVWPRQEKYIDADASLSPDDKQTFKDTGASWRLRLKTAKVPFNEQTGKFEPGK